jgi:nitroreductase
MKNAVLDVIMQRRATRAYTPEPVDEKTVRALLDAAIHAPSASNGQPWSFIVIQDPLLLKRISDRAKLELASHPHWKGTLPLADPQFNIFYGAPTLIVICSKADGFDPTGDCYLAGENLMLAAWEMGLATCPIGLARDILQTSAMKKELNIPADAKPVLPLIVGHPQGSMPSTERKPPVIHAWKR